MLSPQTVSQDASSLFALLGVLASPEETKKQLDELREATSRALELQAKADETMSQALAMKQEVERNAESIAVLETELKRAQTEATARIVSGAQENEKIRLAADKYLRETREMAESIFNEAKNRVEKIEEKIISLQLEATRWEDNAKSAENRVNIAETRLTAIRDTLNAKMD